MRPHTRTLWVQMRGRDFDFIDAASTKRLGTWSGRRPRWLRTALTGVVGGVAGAFILSLWVAIARLVFGTRPFEANGVTLGSVILLYFETLPLCGLLVVLLKPVLWRSMIGAVVLGGLAATPFYIGVALTVPRSLPLGALLSLGSGLAFLVGGAIAASTWRSDRKIDAGEPPQAAA